jgi:hypothetical protein
MKGEIVMADPQSKQTKYTPWHLWVVGILALLWNAIGAMDYVMTQTKNEAYMSQFTPEKLAYIYGFPTWVIVVWAIGVWGGVIGALLLLFRRRLAVWVLLASLLAALGTTIYNYILSNAMDLFGDAGSLIFTGLICLFALGLFLYARAMHKKSVLV